MLSLSSGFNYFLCSEPVTLRYRHAGLRNYIKSHLHRDPTNGDIYIFLSKDSHRVRIYYFHHSGEILTEKILRSNHFIEHVFDEKKTSDFKAQLAAKQNEINALKGIDDGDAPTTTMLGFSSESGMSTEAKLKASEQQNSNLRTTAYGQGTESTKFHHSHQQTMAVKYALVEYPCMLRCLENGSLDLSNNICERQIRRIAKYRNNSYFVGSPESGVRFARLMSHFANIRKHNLDPVEYLSDVFRRIKTTAKDKLVDLLEHRWQPATVGVWT